VIRDLGIEGRKPLLEKIVFIRTIVPGNLFLHEPAKDGQDGESKLH